MNIKEKAQHILREFAEKYKIENVSFNEEERCILAFDSKILVVVILDVKPQILRLQSPLGTLEDTSARYKQLLAANFLWTQTLGANMVVNSEGIALLVRRLDLTHLHLESFEKELENFVNTANYWIDKLEEKLEETPVVVPESLPQRQEIGMRV